MSIKVYSDQFVIFFYQNGAKAFLVTLVMDTDNRVAPPIQFVY